MTNGSYRPRYECLGCGKYITARKDGSPWLHTGKDVNAYCHGRFADVPKREFVCTDCGGDATVAWVNDSGEDIDCFGMTLHPKERVCLACGHKRGNKFFAAEIRKEPNQ